MSLVTVTAPAAEPITLAQLKDFLNVDSDDTQKDVLLTTLGLAAREWCEAYTRRRFITQTVELRQDFFPGYIGAQVAGQLSTSAQYFSGANPVVVGLRYAIELPYPPVQSIASFGYLDPNSGSLVTLAEGTGYTADLLSQPARLTPPFGQLWPLARVEPNAVRVQFVCGYGGSGAVPTLIQTAIIALAAHWYENRLDVNDVPNTVKMMLSRFRNLRF